MIYLPIIRSGNFSYKIYLLIWIINAVLMRSVISQYLVTTIDMIKVYLFFSCQLPIIKILRSPAPLISLSNKNQYPVSRLMILYPYSSASFYRKINDVIHRSKIEQSSRLSFCTLQKLLFKRIFRFVLRCPCIPD